MTTPEPRHGYLDEWDGRLICHECGRGYLHLATHARAAHDLTAAEYRERHGLGMSTSLVASSVAADMRERASRPEMLARLATVRDPDALAAHRGRQSWRPEVVRKAVDRGASTRVPVPDALVRGMPPWEDLLAWTSSAHGIIAQGYAVRALADACGRSQATVAQRLRRHPRT